MELASCGTYVVGNLLGTTKYKLHCVTATGRDYMKEKRKLTRNYGNMSWCVRRKNFICSIINKHPWTDHTVISHLCIRLAYRCVTIQGHQWPKFPQIGKKSPNISTPLIKDWFSARDGDEADGGCDDARGDDDGYN
jgi:hypothetical protein